MRSQIVGVLGDEVLGEIAGGRHCGHTQVAADGHRDHVLGHRPAEAHARIETLSHDVTEAVVDIEFELDIREKRGP